MGLEMKYFVLKPQAKYYSDPHALASQMAMKLYADFISHDDPALAEELRLWAEKEHDAMNKLGEPTDKPEGE